MEENYRKLRLQVLGDNDEPAIELELHFDDYRQVLAVLERVVNLCTGGQWEIVDQAEADLEAGLSEFSYVPTRNEEPN